MKKRNFLTKLLVTLIVFLNISVVACSAFILHSWIAAYKNAYKNGENIVYKTSDILGISTDLASLTIDYSKKLSTSSPLIFGGGHAPFPEHTDAWDNLSTYGITSIRKDFLIEWFFHADTTLASYKNNVKDIQNINNWNQKSIESREIFYKKAKERQLTIFAIVSYAPKWLTYSGTTFGVPKDWEVYKDIVKKSYRRFRSYLDYIEIWNEPDHPRFLDLKNSGMTKEDAYANIFYYASSAIREVDNEINDGKRIPIGGPTLSNVKNNALLQKILTDTRTKDSIDFVSYHYYGAFDDALPIIKNTLQKNNRVSLPIYVTEWSFANNVGKPSPSANTYVEIPFDANRIIYYIRNGIAGTNYHLLEPINKTKSNIDNEPYAFYRWQQNKAQFLPQAKVWRLFSNTLGLGKGNSEIYQALESGVSSSLAFKNNLNESGFIIVNDEYSPKEVSVTVNNNPINTDTYAKAYIASNTHDGISILGTTKLTKNKTLTMKVAVPAQSVVGVILSKNATLEERVKTIFLQ